ncbi:MAG: hypothetical protein H7315_11375 [Herminiimonas sp.]|nr:hypothetical protein [Herminiimonas sp.]
MNDLTNARLAYFETDQINYAAQLWKAVKAAHFAEFDVLKFTQNWAYADDVLAWSLIADDDSVSNSAVELMQMRMLFVEQYAARARKLGAPVSGSAPKATTPARSAAGANGNVAESPHETESPNRRYLKGLR